MMTLLTWLLLLPAFGRQEDPKACDLRDVEIAKYCERCRTLAPKVDERGRCCELVPRFVEACVKTFFECGKCGKQSRSDAPCCPDGEMEKRTSKSMLIYRCEGCGAIGRGEAACISPSCAIEGRRIRRTCLKSGTFPHVRVGS